MISFNLTRSPGENWLGIVLAHLIGLIMALGNLLPHKMRFVPSDQNLGFEL